MRTPMRRRTQKGAHSRSRTRSRSPSAQTELDLHVRESRNLVRVADCGLVDA